MLDLDAVIAGYKGGNFLMAADDGSLRWYSSRVRALIPLDDKFHVSKSLKRGLAKQAHTFKIDGDFDAVVRGCMNRPETWMTEELFFIYGQLHAAGMAHSFECWVDNKLAGGILGLALGSAFIGETMFSAQRDGSKLAMVGLVDHLRQKGFTLFDAQIMNPHLANFGAYEQSNTTYVANLKTAVKANVQFLPID
jgi:leucyl/phenylalanyl-tRNA---protein transferase